MTKHQWRAAWQASVVGLAATVVVVALYAAGGLDWLELKTLDLRFLYANSTPQNPRIACIDIDDGSLATVGRWPWSRDVQAALIALLAELNAHAVLYDITLTEHEPPRLVLPQQTDFAIDPLEINPAGGLCALPDEELRTAIADAGMVYLAFHYLQTGRPPPTDETTARVRAWLAAQPSLENAPPHELFERLLAEAFAGHTAWAEPVALALRQQLGLAATLRDDIMPLDRARAVARPISALTPVYFPLAHAAKRCGFVVFQSDQGVVRRVPLLAQYHGHVVAQLAFALACDDLGVGADDIRAQPSLLELHSRALPRPLHIQLDDDGCALIPWLPQSDWTRQFAPRIPAAVLWQVHDRRQSVAHNDGLIADALERLATSGVLSDQQQYADDLGQRLRLENERRLARYRDDLATVQRCTTGIAEYRRLLAEGEAPLRAAVHAAIERTGTTETPALPDLRAIEHALDANADYQADIASMLARLRPRIAGRLCLVGYTATSLADMVPIPTHPRAPGVLAHANLLNALLTGRSVRWAPRELNAALAALLGIIATLLTAGRGPRQAAFLVLALVVMYATLAGWLAFYAWLYWIGLVPAVGAAILSYGLVLLYRYVFLERESRQIATALSQYTSATLARQMADDAELCRHAETREVTPMFTDLAGFTPLSERIGAERTQHLLNTCLGRLSEVLLQHGAMINKFIGDGVFAFWNPVIYPQPDHARRACAAAIDLQHALGRLITEQREAGGDEAFGELVLRIGVATGSAVVGPCGSEQKYDYTCIGDSVNVAARLESANKFYGTRVLISGPTRQAAGNGFEVRPLGGVQVKGKTRAVPIFELLGRSGAVPDEALRYAERFGAAVVAFQQQDWRRAGQLFEECQGLHPGDLAAQQYAEAVRRFLETPPPANWNGALELTEK